MKTTGSRIKELRERLNVTQEGLGVIAGVTKAAVSQWERDITKPNRDALLNLQRKKQVNPDWILLKSNEWQTTAHDASTINEGNAQYSALSDKETELLSAFRDLPDQQQDIILALLDSMTWGQQKRPYAEPPFPRKEQDNDSKDSAKAPKRAQG